MVSQNWGGYLCGGPQTKLPHNEDDDSGSGTSYNIRRRPLASSEPLTVCLLDVQAPVTKSPGRIALTSRL